MSDPVGSMSFKETGGIRQALFFQRGNKSVKPRGVVLGEPEMVMVLCQVPFVESLQVGRKVPGRIEKEALFRSVHHEPGQTFAVLHAEVFEE
jgi:hypothetical protein